MEKAEQIKEASIISAEGDTEAAELLAKAFQKVGEGLVEPRRIETAEDIAQRTIDLYVSQQRSANSRIYTVGLAISLGIFSVGIAWLSGLFG